MSKKEFKLEKGRGWLFKNGFKDQTNEEDAKKPDYTGNLNVDGDIIKLSLWKAKTKKGDVMLKLSIYEPQGGAKPTNEALSDDDLPF